MRVDVHSEILIFGKKEFGIFVIWEKKHSGFLLFGKTCSGKCPDTIQDCIQKRFHYFPEKRKPSTQFPPVLLQKAVIPRIDTIRFLGFHFHFKQSWIPHINLIRAKCLRELNFLKILFHPKTGCNRKILLPLDQSLICSVLDFG